MDDDSPSTSDSKRNSRLVQRAARMVRSGQLTAEEASRLRAARSPAAIQQVVQDIRVRHASARLATAVAEGAMRPEEAEEWLTRLRSGEHPRGLRAHLAPFGPRRNRRAGMPPTPGHHD